MTNEMKKENTTVMEAAHEKAKTAMKEHVATAKPHEFVEFSFGSEDAFKRREAIKSAQEHVRNCVKKTGGNMPTELIEAYEGLHQVMEHIKKVELEVIRVGR